MRGVHRTPPGLGQIGLTVWLAATVFTIAWYIGTAPMLDGRHTAGFMVSVTAACVLTGQATMLTIIRATIRRDLARQMADGPVPGNEFGTWSDGQPGGIVTVTWLRDKREWWIEGWPTTQWRLDHAGVVDWDALRAMLAALEQDGYRPYDDAGTWSVRQRLGIAGYEDVVETARIHY